MGQQALTGLIEKQLVLDEAKAKNITASEDEINQKSKPIEDSITQSGSTLDKWLVSNGLTKEAYRDQLKVLILVEKLLGDRLNVTDEEVAKYIETYKDSGLTDDDQGRSIAREQLRQEKLSSEYPAYMEELKKSNAVNIFAKY